jgi:hypothetical protein
LPEVALILLKVQLDGGRMYLFMMNFPQFFSEIAAQDRATGCRPTGRNA